MKSALMALPCSIYIWYTSDLFLGCSTLSLSLSFRLHAGGESINSPDPALVCDSAPRYNTNEAIHKRIQTSTYIHIIWGTCPSLVTKGSIRER